MMETENPAEMSVFESPDPTPPELLQHLYERFTEIPFPGMPTRKEVFELISSDFEIGSDVEAISFLEEALERLPEREAETVKRGALVPGINLTDYARDLKPRLQDRIDESFAKSYFKRVFDKGLGPVFDQFAERVNDPQAQADAAGTVVVVSRNCYNLIQREAMYLRRNGYRVFLVNLTQISEELKPAFGQSFDMMLDGVQTYVPLGLLIKRLKPDIFHVQCWMWEYLMAYFVDKHRSHGKLVCEFYDIGTIYAPREHMVKVWWDQWVDLDRAMERYIFRHADGIVHRFPPAVIDDHAAAFGASTRHVEIQQFACPEYVRYGDEGALSETERPIRLVYMGGLIPRSDKHPPEMFPEWGHPEAWRVLLSAGFNIDIYNSMFRQLNDPALAVFRDLEQEFDGFRLLPGVPQDRLTETISGYDFGLLLAEMDKESSWCTDVQFDTCVGTKLYNYLEAGLPVLVNAEYAYMTEIVEANGVGFGIHSRDLAGAPDKIRAFDRVAARSKIRVFNEQTGMNVQISRLTTLYDDILGRPTQ